MGMNTLSSQGTPTFFHPLDIFEQFVELEGWEYERVDENALTMSWQGVFATYHLDFTWVEEMETLHVSSPIDLRVPSHRLAEVKEIVRLINEQSWTGHFDIWTSDGVALFRYGLLLPGGSELSAEQCRSMIEIPVSSWDTYHQAFHFVIWTGKSAQEAIEITQFATEGEA